MRERSTVTRGRPSPEAVLVSLVNDLDELGGPTVLALDDALALASWPLGLGTATTLADPHVRKVCFRGT
jgi:hypothetical protein